MSQVEPAGGRAEIHLTTEYIAALLRLTKVEQSRVTKAFDLLDRDVNHPSLNLHPVQSDPRRRLHTFRASDELRVLCVREGSVFVLLDVGHHDRIYRTAERMRVVIDPMAGAIRVFTIVSDAADDSRDELSDPYPRVPEDTRRGIFDHWDKSNLVAAGFEPSEIEVLRTCRSEDDLFELALASGTIERAMDLVETTPEAWLRERAAGEKPTSGDRLRRALEEFGGTSGLSGALSADELAQLLAAPIEDWMVFLHPEQRKIAMRRLDGPGRVRGSAGTGKTVVALHRAAALAKRFHEGSEPNGAQPRLILFTTFVRTLSPVLENLYQRIPGARVTGVEFVHIDRVANLICREAGDQLRTVPREIDAAFASAWKKVVLPGSPLARRTLTRGYIQEEISSVIKGRGVPDVDEYLSLVRTGRRTRFDVGLRRQVWELREEWDRQMRMRGTVDFPDVLLRAREHATTAAAPRYRAAIIDEVQDITLVGLQLVRLLVNRPESTDRADGLFLVGDGAQRVYPGGFTLRQAGVETRGRTTVLNFNYRNTGPVLAAAMAVAGDQPVDDLGDEFNRGDAEAVAERGGIKPVLAACANFEGELRFILERIQGLKASGAIGFGDMAVCAVSNRVVDEIRTALAAASIPSQGLDDYKGTPTNFVKVGTFQRAKGLEFKVVFLPGLTEGEFPRPAVSGQDPLEHDDQRSLSISQLFVAMTRARDGLFVTCSNHPSEVLASALDWFELIDSR